MGKLISGFERMMINLAAVCVFIMMCLTAADATGRYLLNMPVPGANQITEQYLMVASVFLGVWYAYRRGAFVRVTFFVDRLPKQAKAAAEYLVLIFSLLSNAFFVVATFKQFLRTVATGTTLDLWNLPLWPPYLLIPIGLFFICLAMLIDLTRVRAGEADLFKEESPTT
jgi:TRAP-type C4-dicarboxylate transport system permease small subunit